MDPGVEILLRPVSPESPCGADLRHAAVYAEIREAQREEEEAAQGVWQRARKTADWPLVSKLCARELERSTKDLQLAVWWLMAETKLRGIPGLALGFQLVNGLVNRYWDGIQPEIEDGDLGLRMVPLHWMATKLDIHLRQIPLTKAGHGWFKLKESQSVPPESDTDDRRRLQREVAVSEGKLTPEDFQQGLAATPTAYLDEALGAMAEVRDSVRELQLFTEEHCGEDAPGFGRLLEALDEVAHSVQQLKSRKAGPVEPIPTKKVPTTAASPSIFGPDIAEEDPEPTASPVDIFGDSVDDDESPEEESSDQDEPDRQDEEEDPRPLARPRPTALGQRGWEELLCEHAARLRMANPSDPSPYLMLRGLRWGELRARGLDVAVMTAPPVEVRRALKALRIAEDWRELLEQAEHAVGQPWGRTWLDPHCYTLLAAEGLGEEYNDVARAVARELRQVVSEFPLLPDATLDDDSSAANSESRAMLARLPDGGPPPRPRVAIAAAPSAADWPLRLQRETSGRGRFLCRVEVAAQLLAAGRAQAALPMLRALTREIDERGLEQWERHADLVKPVRLLCEALRSLDMEMDGDALLLLYRLDPMQAAEFA